jgi:hypothetical protein
MSYHSNSNVGPPSTSSGVNPMAGGMMPSTSAAGGTGMGSSATTTTGTNNKIGSKETGSTSTAHASSMKPKVTKATGMAATNAKKKRPSAMGATISTASSIATTAAAGTMGGTSSSTSSNATSVKKKSTPAVQMMNTNNSTLASAPSQLKPTSLMGGMAPMSWSMGGGSAGVAINMLSNLNYNNSSNTGMNNKGNTNVNSTAITAQQQQQHQQRLLQDARTAKIELGKLRADAAAKRADPLWYRGEDVMPIAADDTSRMASPSCTSILPEEMQIVEQALSRNGLTRMDVTPQAFACLLEQARRYAIELVTDAQEYAYVADPTRFEVSRADLMVAAELRSDSVIAMTAQVPKLNFLAQQVNRKTLPPIPAHCYSGVVLPPQEHQLTARTYDIVSSAQIARRMVRKVPELPPPSSSTDGEGNSNTNSLNRLSSVSGTSKSKSSSTPKSTFPTENYASTYGAARGRQIPIKLKEPLATAGTSS